MSGRLLLERCRHCKGRNFKFIDGMYGVISEDKHDVQEYISKAVDVDVSKSHMWGWFCQLLDSIRSRMADGSSSDRTCLVCEYTHVADKCTCACHPAWAYRKQIEDEVARGKH
jgi:hypothetical protein